MFSEKALWCHILLVENIHERNGILAQAGSENDNLVILGNLVDELTAARPYVNEFIVDTALYINRQHDICLLSWLLETWVN